MRNPLRYFKQRETLISARNLARAFLRFFLQVLNRSEPEQQQSTAPMDPAPFDPLKPDTPVSFPIKTLEDLESRSYYKSFHYPFNKSSVPLPSVSVPSPARPRLLVCHDMAGGYTDDKWIQGGSNEGAYAIWHWYLIDVFVYFSHNLVTIPPPCWTNTAHKHGVKVLGTFITEWAEGTVTCNKLLSTKESAQMYAERLTELAVSLGFDGWLINMEVKLDVGQIPNLKEFVLHLTQTMHSSVPGSLVIWYDSVTVGGKLSWQDQLNDKNKPFFDLCDGIFVNYTWEENYPKISAAAAGDRKFDVYMGIDVFGRSTYGGGQWNTNVALDVLKKDKVSAAIFAPGWVYETKQPPDFQTAQNRWWGLVEQSWGVLQCYPKVLPFYSNFDQGYGYHFSVDGHQVFQGPWCNISLQGFQPVLANSGNSATNSIKVLVNFEDASYSGGANITFKGTLEDDAYFITRLFQGELPLDNLPIHITHSVRAEQGSLLGLSLKFISDMKRETSVLFASCNMRQFLNKFDKVIVPVQAAQLGKEATQIGPGWIKQESSIMMRGYTLTEISVVCYKLKPDLGERKEPSDYYASLGHIAIQTSNTTYFPPSNSWVVKGQNITWSSGSQGAKTLSVKIVWSLAGGDYTVFSGYNIYVVNQRKEEAVRDDPDDNTGEKEYLGVARVTAFYVSNLEVPQGTFSLRFIIQVCGIDGSFQKLDSSPALILGVDG